MHRRDDARSPRPCTGNVDGLADGNYDFRAVATDLAGNTLASTVQTNRRVDTDGPVTSVTTPANGTRVSGNVTLTAAATDPAGVASVQFQVFSSASGSRSAPTTPRATPARATRPRSPTAPTRSASSPPTPSGTRPTRRSTTLIIDNTRPERDDGSTRPAPAHRTAASTPATRSRSPGPSRWRPPRSSPAGTAARSPSTCASTNNGGNDLIYFYSTGRHDTLNITERRRPAANANYVIGRRVASTAR